MGVGQTIGLAKRYNTIDDDGDFVFVDTHSVCMYTLRGDRTMMSNAGVQLNVALDYDILSERELRISRARAHRKNQLFGSLFSIYYTIY